MSSELVPRQQWDLEAARLAEEYAGITDARDLTPDERVYAIASLVPSFLHFIEEARDTIERLNTRVETLEGQEHIEDAEVEE